MSAVYLNKQKKKTEEKYMLRLHTACVVQSKCLEDTAVQIDLKQQC